MEERKYETILVEGGVVATITINRPDKLNALNTKVFHDLAQALQDLENEKETRAVILTGSGEKAFVAGADIGEIAEMAPWQAVSFVEYGQNVMFRMEASKLPIIAAINGFALGGGCELAMAADVRYASSKARFGQPEAKLGLIPGFGGTQRLPRLIGKGKALELILGAGMIKADEAFRVGLIDKICEPEKLMEEVRNLAETIAAQSPAAVALAKRAVMRSFATSLKEGCAFESVQFGVVNSTDDKAEGTKAFLEKREPNYTGR